jgi:hypothetical protein
MSFAQVDFGSPASAARGGATTASSKDWEAIEINPANLGHSDNKVFSLTIMNVGVNFQDKDLAASQVTGHITNFNLKDSANLQELKNWVTAPGGFNFSTTVNWLAFSLCIPKLGGLGISLTDEAYFHTQLTPTFADILFNGINAPEFNRFRSLEGIKSIDSLESAISRIPGDETYLQTLSQQFNGSNAGGYHYRELNIDYGHKLYSLAIHSGVKGGASFENSEYINPKVKTSDTVTNYLDIFGGFGFKPIWGFADLDATAADGVLTSNDALVNNYPKNIYQLHGLGSLFNNTGHGYGIDLGLSATYKKWKLGFSVIDLGKITWQNNQLITTNALTPNELNTALLEIIQDTNGGLNETKAENQILKDFVNTGHGPDYTTDLPSKFRSGISYQVSHGILLSSDFVVPLNKVSGNLINPYWSVGAQIHFFNILDFSVGYVTEKSIGNFIPVGIFLSTVGSTQLFIATNDITAYLSNSTGHEVSLAFGIRVFGL